MRKHRTLEELGYRTSTCARCGKRIVYSKAFDDWHHEFGSSYHKAVPANG